MCVSVCVCVCVCRRVIGMEGPNTHTRTHTLQELKGSELLLAALTTVLSVGNALNNAPDTPNKIRVRTMCT